MKSLKEPLSRLANRQENARGAFFNERFRTVGHRLGRGLFSIDTKLDPLHVECPVRRRFHAVEDAFRGLRSSPHLIPNAVQ
jgi:hypothetical protein